MVYAMPNSPLLHRVMMRLCLAVGLALGAGGDAMAWDGEAWADYSPYISPVTPAVARRIEVIAREGRALGRVPGRVGHLGDSMTESYAFLRNVLVQNPASNETGHDYEPVITWIRKGYSELAVSTGRLGDHLGKGDAYGNRGGWTLEDFMKAGHPQRAVESGDGIDPGNFSWAIVLLGSNDLHRRAWKPVAWRDRLRTLVLDVVDLGIVPVLSTIPPRADHRSDGRVEQANLHIRSLARTLELPLVDFYGLIVETRPDDWHGTLISDDGVHPSAGGGGRDFSRRALESEDGYAARSKLVLDVAEKLMPLLTEVYGADAGAPGPGS